MLKKVVRKALKRFGYEIQKTSAKVDSILPVELSVQERDLISYVKGNHLSMVSDERLFATIMSCKYVLERDIEGDFVECGVWRGGNSIIAAGIFKLYKSNRKVYLYDTFEGMTSPTEDDYYNTGGQSASLEYRQMQKESHNEWCYASLDDVKNNFRKSGLLEENVIFVKGDVAKTLSSGNIPEKISVLRLDTDWYESTKKELEVFYPKLSELGVIMIDDYGHWAGSKKAVDEFFTPPPPVLWRGGSLC